MALIWGIVATSHLSLVLYASNFRNSNMLSKPAIGAIYSLCLLRLTALIFARLVAYLYFLL